MKALLTLATLLFAQQLFADQIKVNMDFKVHAVYTALSDTRFEGSTAKASGKITFKGHFDGQDINLTQDMPESEGKPTDAKLELIFGNGKPKVKVENAGQSIEMEVTFSKDENSFVAHGKAFEKAFSGLLKEQTEQIKEQLGANGKFSESMDGSSMTCVWNNPGYTCDTLLKVKLIATK